MTVIIKVGEADPQLSELLERVEAGEEVVIERAGQPVARLTRVVPRESSSERDVSAVIEEMLAARARRQPVTREEIQAWKNEGRR